MPPAPSYDPPARTPSRTAPRTEQRSGSGGGGSSSGTAVSRGSSGGSTSGSSSSGGSRTSSGGSSSSSASSVRGGEPSGRSIGSAIARERGNRPATGQAVERPLLATTPGLGYQVIYNSWSPWYSGRYGYRYGYGYYGCGWCYSRYYWNPYYGYGYPYSWYGYYDPFWSFGASTSVGYSSSARDSFDDAPRREVGSIRIKANLADAKVYIDGVLVGVVDDFDGLSDHLELDAGPHEMEIRAEGYRSLVKDIVVKSGKTMTERVSLKKQ